MVDSGRHVAPGRRVQRIQALFAEVGTQMRVASRLVTAVFRIAYDFFTAACLAAAAVVIINGRTREALVWGGTGLGLVLGWVAARVARRGVARFMRSLREEWNTASSADVDRSEKRG